MGGLRMCRCHLEPPQPSAAFRASSLGQSRCNLGQSLNPGIQRIAYQSAREALQTRARAGQRPGSIQSRLRPVAHPARVLSAGQPISDRRAATQLFCAKPVSERAALRLH